MDDIPNIEFVGLSSWVIFLFLPYFVISQLDHFLGNFYWWNFVFIHYMFAIYIVAEFL